MTPRIDPRPARIAVALLLATLAPAAGAQSTDLAGMTDKVFASWNSTHTPGCAVGIAQGGKSWGSSSQ